MKTKICTKCHEVKPLEDFHNRKIAKDGKKSCCKICGKKHEHRSRRDPKKAREYNRKYHEEHREERNEYARQYHEEHREESAEKRRGEIKELKASYTKKMIHKKYNISPADISEEMIERERELIKINRLFRRQSNVGKKKIN